MPMCRPSAAGRWNVEDTPGEVRTASRPPPLPMAPGSRMWRWYLAGGSVIVAVTLALPDGLTRDVLYQLVALSAPVAILVGLRVHAPRQRAPWLLLALATLLWALGSLYWAWAVDIAYVPPQPSPADVMYLVAYPVLAGSLFLIGRRRRAKGDLPSLLDAMIVVSVVALVVWVLVLDPVAAADLRAAVDRIERTVPKLLGASMGVPRSRGALAASGVCPIGVVDA